MDDDLGVPQALAEVHNTVRDGNAALAEQDKDTVRAALAAVHAMTAVLGISPLAWRSAAPAETGRVVDALIAAAVEQRNAARARKDFGTADTIRDQLAAAGVLIEDTAGGTRWTIQDSR
jgi:cysteinyl-tRNA synthetase